MFFDSTTARTQILNYIFLATDDELVDIGLDVHLLNVGLVLNMMEWIGTWPKKEQRALGLPFEDILEQMEEHCGHLADRCHAPTRVGTGQTESVQLCEDQDSGDASILPSRQEDVRMPLRQYLGI